MALIPAVEAIVDTRVVYITCSGALVDSVDYRLLKRDVTQALARITWSQNYNYYVSAVYNNLHCYGHGTCNVNPSDLNCPACRASIDQQCEYCLWEAKKQLDNVCHPNAIGAQVKLGHCYMRFEPVPFTDP